MSLRIKKGDMVEITAGKDKGKNGNVLKIFPDKNRAIVEGVNVVKKHQRRRSEQQQSGIVEKTAALHMSNLALWCPSCKKGVRFSVKVNDDKSKSRICSKCSAQI